MTESGDSTLQARAYVFLGLVALGVLILGVGMWALTAQIGGAVVAHGQIAADRVRQIVQHPTGGVAAEILVRDGMSVERDDLLIRLDTRATQEALDYAQAQLFELRARQARLGAAVSGAPAVVFPPDLVERAARAPQQQAVLDGQAQLFDAARATRQSQRAQRLRRQHQISARIDGIEAQRTALSRQIQLVEAALEDQRALLARGLVPQTSVLGFEREAAQLAGRAGELGAARAEAQAEIDEIETELQQLDDQSREQALEGLRSLEEEIRRYHAEIVRLQGELAVAEIRAPAAGIVHEMILQTPRAVLRPAEPILSIVPQDRPRLVISHVPPAVIDEVSAGQEVRLRLSALNQRVTPEIGGRVVAVSAAAIEDARSGATYFRVDIAPDANDLARLPAGAILLPGMPVETFILTGSRRPIDYFLRPMRDYFARALRES